MTSRSQIPDILAPLFRQLSPASLILLTGTLDSSIDWLTARFIGSALNPHQYLSSTLNPAEYQDTPSRSSAVLLVSCLKDVDYWKTELKRSAAIDYRTGIKRNRIEIIDCVSSSPFPSFDRLEQKLQSSLSSLSEDLNSNRSATPAQPDVRQVSTSADVSSHDEPSTTSNEAGGNPIRIMVVLDGLDALLAVDPGAFPASRLNELVLSLRDSGHAVVLACAGDGAFIAPAAAANLNDFMGSSHLLSAAQSAGTVGSRATSYTLLELEQAAFVTSQIHAATTVLSARQLDTGPAKDVSGVLRVTRGGSAYEYGEDISDGISRDHVSDSLKDGTEEMEVLYLIQKDGRARVALRGSDLIP